MLEPFENCDRDGLGRFQNHVPDKTIADDHLDWIFKQVAAFDVSAEIERGFLQQLENFLRQLGAFYIFLAQGYQTHRRFFVTEDVARINRTHNGILQKMLGPRVRLCARIDQDKDVELRWQNGCDPWAVDPG